MASEPTHPILVHVPVALHERIADSARTNDRSVAAEVRSVLRREFAPAGERAAADAAAHVRLQYE